MWSDNEADVDLLRFQYLASTIVRLTQTPHLLPTTIGIFSDWGGGKSTLLKLAQAELTDAPDALCLTFSGWLFEGYEDAKSALMGTILDAIQEQAEAAETLSEKGRTLLGKLFKRVDWMQVASLAGRYALPAVVGLPHLTIANVAHDIVKTGKAAQDVVREKGIDPAAAQQLLKDAPGGAQDVRRNIRDFRRDFAELLAEAKISTLVVFIDDLDRCLPDTIIETLEAIKLFLYVPGTAFVLAADERIIKYAVRQRFPELPGDETEVGRDYLEKLVQIPIRVPPLSGADVWSFMNLLFAQLHLDAGSYSSICQHVATFRPGGVSELSFDLETARRLLDHDGVSADLEQDLDLATQIAPVLIPGLAGNPRRTKRFLNALLLRLQMGQGRGLELQRRVLAKLMLLEYLKPEFFLQLARLQAAQDGKPRELAAIERRLRQAESSSGVEFTMTEDESGADQIHARSASEQEIIGQEADDAAATIDSDAELPIDVQTWLADSWMRTWITAEPSIADIDLRPYYYIAHDIVGSLDASPLRLSPVAEDVLHKLLSPGPTTQQIGLTRSINLSAPDATAVFHGVALRVRQAELLDERSPQRVLFKLVEKRPELAPQIVALYNDLPTTKLTASTPPLLWELVKGTPSEGAARATIQRWSDSANTVLANAARYVLSHHG